jgi:hypothetical protein
MRCLSLLILMCLASSARAQPQADLTRRPTPELLRLLGSDQFRERDAAQRALEKRDEAFAEIRRARSTLNAEGRRRVDAILAAMATRRSAQFVKYAHEGRIDLLIEWTQVAPNCVSDADYWSCVIDLANEVKKRSNFDVRHDLGRPFPPRSFDAFLKDHATLVHEDGTFNGIARSFRLAVRARKLDIQQPAVHDGLLVSAADAEARFVSHIVLIALGDVKLDLCSDCIIIADGTVTTDRLRSNVVAVDRGGVNYRPFEGQYDLLYRNGPQPGRRPWQPDPSRDESDERRSEGGAQARAEVGVQFFNLSDVGLNVDDELKVYSVRAASPLAKAGLKPGDTILAVDGEASASTDALRRQLRRAFVIGGAELTIRRGGETLTLTTTFLGWKLPPVTPSGR